MPSKDVCIRKGTTMAPPIEGDGALMTAFLQKEYRLPLVPMSARNRETLKATLMECGVLKG